MAANHSQTYVVNTSVDNIRAIVRNGSFAGFLKIKFKAETPLQNGVWFHFSSGVNLSSWGEDIDINVLYIDENSSQVTIKSECALPTQVFDWGKNKQNVEKVYNHLIANVNYSYGAGASAGSAYQQPVQRPVYQQPVQRPVYQPPPQQPVYQQPVVRGGNGVCRNCGAPLAFGVCFCGRCGTKVENTEV